MQYKAAELAAIVKGKLNKDNNIIIKKIVTDSRLADKDSLFVPLKGEKNDGHNFIKNARDNGCMLTLSCEDENYSDMSVIKVCDTLTSMGNIAKDYVNKINPFRIAITGSVGKTTTKELVYSVMSNIRKTLKTNGNFNNNIGLPLTVFRLEDEEVGIFEMGMNHFSEIDYLSKIVNPDMGIITNIGHSHIENLGSREGILKAKCELIPNMRENGILILNGDDEYLRIVKNKFDVKIIYYGINNKDSQIIAENIREYDGYTVFSVKGEDYRVNLTGRHNVYNALCAVCAGMQFTDDLNLIKEGLLNYTSSGIRQNTVEKNNIKIIIDCYNAAPDSFIAALNVLKKTEGKRKIAVFGSVAELGKYRDKLLYEVGKQIAESGIDALVAVTDDSEALYKGAKDRGMKEAYILPDNNKASEFLKAYIKKGDVLLIKGSRLYRMEEISESLLEAL